MKLFVDLNADLGEGSGHDNELFELISSASIATGFHAGDSDTMHAAVCAAKEHGVAVGAHPSFFDRENFGRKELKMSNEEVFDAVAYQLGIFQAIASALDVRPNHVKPHGALYNMAVRDPELADAIARAIKSVDPKLILFAPDNSELARAGEAHGVQIAREIFADRNYLNDGWLVPRTRPDALLRDPKEAAQRVLRMLREGKVRSIESRDVDVRGETICVHGDTPGAVEFARELRMQLEREGVRISAPKSSLCLRRATLEPARPRAAGCQLCGPRAGRLQRDRPHFAIWHMCRRFVTIQLSSLRRALINELEFWLRRNARGFWTKSGSALPTTMAGTWAIMFSCRITCIFFHGLKSVRAVWPIGCRCGKA